MGRRVVIGLLLAVLGGAVGFVVGDRMGDRDTTTATVARTVTSEAAGLPAAVDERRAEILRAAEAGDHGALARLASADFTYTFGGPVPGGPAAYWQEAERRGEGPLEALAAVLKLPYTLSRGIYVWPFAYDKPPEELTQYEQELLREIPGGAPAVGAQGYLGWRVGIRPDGSWIYFVAGD
jgi:hypothetical protein